MTAKGGDSPVSRLRHRPESVAVVASLILSAIALLGDPVVNRDGMLYISIAREVLVNGPDAAFASFSWPFLPWFLSGISFVTTLDAAVVARGYSLVTMALMSLVAVRLCARLDPRFAWPAVLFVLGSPVFNWYRADVLRDTGAWLLLLVALEQLLLWQQKPDWKRGVMVQFAVVAAALFRPEMITVFAGIFLWLLFSDKRRRYLGAIHLLGPPAAAGLAVVLFLVFHESQVTGRLDQIVGVLDLSARVDAFNGVAADMADRVLNEHSRDEAGQILLVGLLSIIFTKWLKLTGIFVVPLGWSIARGADFRDRALFLSMLFPFALMLALFVTWSFYLASRHVAVLALLGMPWACDGLLRLGDRFSSPPWRWAGVGLVIVAALAGVISTGSGKGYIRDAGQWLAEQDALLEGEVYFSSREVAWYATGRYPDEKPELSSQQVASEPGEWKTLVFAVRGREGEEVLRQKLDQRSGYHLVKRFDNNDGKSVVVYSTLSR